jgi:ADP-ribosylglycohydrolase
MRCERGGIAFDTLDDVRKRARESAAVTHDHLEGIRGAEATAAAVFLARNGRSQSEIRRHVESEYGYDLSRTLDGIREDYEFDETCQGSVPEAITAFLESRDSCPLAIPAPRCCVDPVWVSYSAVVVRVVMGQPRCHRGCNALCTLACQDP